MTASRCAVALVAFVSCRRASTEPPPPPRTVAALYALREGLDRDELRGVVDPVPLARAELLERLGRMHDLQEANDAVGITVDGWRRSLATIDSTFNAAGLRREFRSARALLGSGPCAQTAPAQLPDALVHIAAMRPTWPAFVETELRTPLAQRAASAHAGEFRCEGGSGPFRALFFSTEAGDRLLVAKVTAR